MVAAGPLHNSNITKKYIEGTDWEVHWHLEVNIIMSIEYNTTVTTVIVPSSV